jgi:hypothetical protein
MTTTRTIVIFFATKDHKKRGLIVISLSKNSRNEEGKKTHIHTHTKGGELSLPSNPHFSHHLEAPLAFMLLKLCALKLLKL